MARICLIEDDPTVRKVLYKVLSGAGHFVSAASNGREGLELMEHRDFDLVVTDIIMPEMEGIEMIRRVRDSKPDLKIIAMSGGGRVGNTDFLKIAKNLGADEIIYKPVTRTDFLETVNRCLVPG